MPLAASRILLPRLKVALSTWRSMLLAGRFLRPAAAFA